MQISLPAWALDISLMVDESRAEQEWSSLLRIVQYTRYVPEGTSLAIVAGEVGLLKFNGGMDDHEASSCPDKPLLVAREISLPWFPSGITSHSVVCISGLLNTVTITLSFKGEQMLAVSLIL